MSADIVASLDRAGADVARIARRVIASPTLIPALLDALEDRKARVKYGAEKVLRAVSERRPELLQPHFGRIAKLMEAENTFIKWGATRTIANVAAAGPTDRLAAFVGKYVQPLSGPDMVTAATTIGGLVTIARARPTMTGRIAREILKVEQARYEMHGEASPECRNVACGHAIDAFDALYQQIDRKKPVIEFVRRQLGCSRPSVRKKAEAFLKRRGL